MLIHKAHPVLTGFLWGVGMALMIGVVVGLVNGVDILLSQRFGYSDFRWSGVHGVAVLLLLHGLLHVQDRSTYLCFGVEWLVFTLGVYWWVGRQFPTAAAQRKCILGFVVGFPIASLGVELIVVMLLFVMSVLKFGFV